MDRILPWLVLAGWLAAGVIAEYLRPGELLEFGLVGVAGLCAWNLVRSLERPRLQLMAALLFFVPLLNTWPARALFAQIESLGPAAYVLAPSSALAVLIVAMAPARRHFGGGVLPSILIALILASVVTSSVASSSTGSAAASAWIAFLAPLAVSLAVARTAETTRERWTFVALASLASLVPAGMGVAAYVVTYDVPLSLDDLRAGKSLLYRTSLVQEVTFGNIAHLAAFALLATPPLAAAAFARSLPNAARACGAVSATLLVSAVFLSYSRAAFLVLALLLASAAALIGMRSGQKHSLAGLAAALVVAAAATPVAAVGSSSLEPETSPGSGSSPTATFVPDASVGLRWSAIRAGMEIFDAHRLGVGSGQYAVHDPQHTAPHSLFVRLLAENGVFGGAALVVLLLLLLASLRRLVQPLSDDEWLLHVGCFLGSFGFLAYGVVAGAPLALGAVGVWSLLLGVQLGVLLSTRERQA